MRTKWGVAKGLRPVQIMIVLATIILVGGFLIGELIPALQTSFKVVGRHGWAIIDPLLLLAMVAPALYFMAFKPLIESQVRLEEQIDVLRANDDMATLIEALPDAVILKDGDGRWMITNESARQLFRLPNLPWQGKTSTELASLHPVFHAAQEGSPTSEDDEEKVWQSGRTHVSEGNWRVGGDDHRAIMETHKVPIFGEDGQRKRLAIIMRDITALRLGERKIRDSELLHRTLMQAAFEGIHIIDEQGNVIEANDAFCRMLGYTQKEMAHLKVADWDAQWSKERLQKRFRERIGGGIFLETVQRRKDGVMIDVEISASGVDLGGRKYIFCFARDITARKRIEKERLIAARAFEVQEGIVVTDANMVILRINESFTRVTGYSPEEIVGQTPRLLQSGRQDSEFYRRMWDALIRDRQWQGEIWNRRKNGEVYPEFLSITAVLDGEGQITNYVGFFSDITAHKAAEEEIERTARQLQQAQKMEAVGQLTGGLAHDFNNLLAVAIGNLDLIAERSGDDARTSEFAEAALGACLRGAELTRQLLAFSRRQPLRPEPIAPAETLRAMTTLLDRTLGEQVTLQLRAQGGLWRIIADPTQLETAVLNLAVNARDAMPDGGILSIEIANARLDPDYASQNPEVVPGDYVEIAVSDTGTGMPPDIVARAFDPFFTTKDTGHGTGLGLSMVYGFIRQSGGHIKIYSEPGQGTTIKLWLPRVVDSAEQAQDGHAAAPETAPRGSETVLVVEDNAAIRKVVVRQMQDLGYRTIEAGDAHAALDILETHEGIDLLFTDVVMPGGKDGRALASEATALMPGLKVLFTSGFPQVAGGEPLTAPLLSKPYRKQELAEVLRRILGSRRHSAP